MKLESLFLEIQKEFSGWSEQKRDVEDIISFHTGLSWGDLQIKRNLELKLEHILKIKKDIEELKTGKPCAYILGHKTFYKSEFKVGPGVLIPRPETEIMVEKALQINPQPQRVVDLGTGSGCIGLSLAKEWQGSQVVLIDSSQEALALCRDNQKQMGVDNVEIYCLSVSSDEPKQLGKFDLIVANPPYIAFQDSRVARSVHLFEPHTALYAEQNGLECIRNWLLWAEKHLNLHGQYLFEFGQHQEDDIETLILNTSFTIVEIIDDYQGNPRFFQLQKRTG